MHERKVGVWLIGGLGTISVTLMLGVMALRKGLCGDTGMVTATAPFAGLDLVAAEDLEFGGCDIRQGSLLAAAHKLVREAAAIDAGILPVIEADLEEIETQFRPGTAHNCGEMIESMADGVHPFAPSLPRQVEAIRGDLRAFKKARRVDELVVVNLASTEPPLVYEAYHHDLNAFEARLADEDGTAARASTLYAYAAIAEGCPYINFTPSTGALVPALIRFAEEQGVPVMGDDGKTGETLVKSALAPMFVCRNLEVLSWEGFNILGNMDGQVLNNPRNCASKLKTKDQVLGRILGYSPHSGVHINYVPSLGDQKTAWDFIHFKGFLGAKMSLQFIWQGYDSILAAPLVLDLIRMAVLAKGRGEGGLMPQLASFFKAPLGVDEHGLERQFSLLMNYVKRTRENWEQGPGDGPLAI